MGIFTAIGEQAVSTRTRQRIVDEIVRSGDAIKPSAVHEILTARGIVNASTGQPFSVSTVRNDIKTMPARGENVREIIGRVETVVPLWSRWRAQMSVDQTQTDYEFWDKLRRGKATGFKLGALFCMPLTQIVASFVMGDGVAFELADTVEASEANIEYTNGLLARFSSRYHRLLLGVVTDLYGLGDQYIAVNPDATLSVISPELVELEWNDLDYRRIEKVRVVTRLEKHEITDEYRADGRTVTLRGHRDNKRAGNYVVNSYELENLIGRLPIIHFPNDRGANEIYGRPIYEALYHLFSRYDDLIEKALDGAELMGNPMPTFEGMENISETVAANATEDTETYTDIDGNTETRNMLNWDRLGVLFIGKGGRFEFKSPTAGFTADVRDMLKSLFLLLLDYTRVPEYVWGGAIASSRASAETQAPPFYQYIQGRRVALEGDGTDEEVGSSARGGLYELIDVWLRTKALTDPRVVVGPVVITWPELARENWESLLKWVSYLRGIGAMDDETALTLFGKADDPTSVLEKARLQADDAWTREQMRRAETYSGQMDEAERTARARAGEDVNDVPDNAREERPAA